MLFDVNFLVLKQSIYHQVCMYNTSCLITIKLKHLIPVHLKLVLSCNLSDVTHLCFVLQTICVLCYTTFLFCVTPHLLFVLYNICIFCYTTCAFLLLYTLVMSDISNFEFDTIFFAKNIDISIFFDISKLLSILALKYRYIESGRYFD